nr:ribonuclease H-like domain-containing protein [Tanacetum cinerariifolium]
GRYIVTTAKIITEVVAAASTTITVADVPIPAATAATAPTLTAAPSRRTKGIVIRDPEESTTTSTITHSEAKSKDKGRGILMDYFKGMSYDDIRLIFEKQFDSNVDFLQNTKEQIGEEDSRALKRLNESQEEKAAKKQKLDEEIITFTTTQLILLVKRRYPLTRFTLDQMLNNVRLEVKEESEVSLELLSFGIDVAEESQGKHAKHVVPAAVLTQSKLVPIADVQPLSIVVPKISVTRPRQAKTIVTKTSLPPRRHINRSPSPKASNSPPRVTAVKALVVNAAKGMQGKGEWKPKYPILDHGNPQHALKDKGVIDSGCSRHMTGNMSYLSDFKKLNGGYVAFGGNPKGGKIFGKGKIRTGKLDFDDVYFVKELKFNLFSVSQMCDKKNSVLFTDTECLVLSPEFKLPDENQVLLRVPRENNMYNVNLKNIVLSMDLTCLFAKATLDESNLWHRRLGHINFKTMNNLVKGLENQLSLKVKVIKSDNGTEFKNIDLNQFCGMKGIKIEFSVPRTPQQNGIAKRKNKTLIEAASYMLVDSLLPIPF